MFLDENWNIIRNTDDRRSDTDTTCVVSKYQDQMSVYAEPNKVYYVGIGTEFDYIQGKQYGNYTITATCTETQRIVTASPTTESPTQSPTTQYPTPAPTPTPTKILQFGHSWNDTNATRLYLYEFEPALFEETIDLIHFGALNGTVSFEPCEYYDTTNFDEYLWFDVAASRPWVSSTNVYNVADLYVNKYLECADGVNCYMQCIDVSFVCVGSELRSSFSPDYTYIACDSRSACLESAIYIYQTEEALLKCADTGSCRGSVMDIQDVLSFTLECVSTESCTSVYLNMTNVEQGEIRCYAINSCESIRIYSNTNDIKFLFYNFNQDVHLYLPSHFDKTNLDCNPLNAYLTLDGATDIEPFNESARVLFGGGMPCENMIISFSESGKVDCDIRYEFKHQNQMQSIGFIQDFMTCFSKIYIDEISDYDCFGTRDPTSDPTQDPTKYPTNDPTRDPTGDPTGHPTLNPSFDPTDAPTVEPTIEPTLEPTTIPTLEPTLHPTRFPSTDPTMTPTKTPTRKPTVDKAYDSFFDITYLLQNLLDEHILTITQNAVRVFTDITEFAETAYVENLVALSFSDFQLIIDTINNIKVSKIKENMWVTFANSKDELKLQSRLLCNEVMCDYILKNYNITTFEKNCENKIREYFNDSTVNANADADAEGIGFKVDISEAFIIQELYPNLWYDPKLIALMAFILIMSVLAVMALLHNKDKICKIPGSTVVDDAMWLVFFLLALQLWDFISDINLSIEMLTNESNDPNVGIVAYLSLIFIIVPYVSNLYMASRIKSFVASNETAVTYFTNNSGTFVLLVCMCGSCYVSLQFVSSAVFGFNAFNSGLTRYEIRKLSKLKVIGTIFLENSPQLVLQIVYSFLLGTISDSTYLSFIASMISVIAAVLTYCIEKGEDSNENWKVVEYYICTENDYSTDVAQRDKESIVQEKGRTELLSKSLAAIFSTQHKNIDIGKAAVVTNHGVLFHAVHFISMDDIDAMQKIYAKRHSQVKDLMFSAETFISELYVMFKKEVNIVLCNHLKLDVSFKTNILPHYGKKTNSFTDRHDKFTNMLLSQSNLADTTSQEIALAQYIDKTREATSDGSGETGTKEKLETGFHHMHSIENNNPGQTAGIYALPSYTGTERTTVEIKADDESSEDMEKTKVVSTPKSKPKTKTKKKKSNAEVLMAWFKSNVDLEKVHCEKYCDLLISNGFNSKKSIKNISEDKLMQIGIKRYGHRKAILSAIKLKMKR